MIIIYVLFYSKSSALRTLKQYHLSILMLHDQNVLQLLLRKVMQEIWTSLSLTYV